jgi:ketosteroid isomerase-like protein
MSQENVEIVRQRVSILPQPRRHPEERLALRFPRLTAFALWAFSRLPVHSRLRRELLSLMVRRGIGATNRGDYEAAFAAFHPDVEVLSPPDLIGLGEAARYQGLSERIAFQRKWTSEWEEVQFFADEILDLGNRVLLLGRIKGRGLSSGAPFDDEWANLLTLSAGRVIREQIILDHAKALEAAGLSE